MYINNLVTGTMTLGSGGSTPSGHSDTRVTYTTESGLPDWSGEIEGGLENSPFPIPNKEDIETINIGTTVSSIDSGTFWECSNLIQIVIPNTLQYVQWNGFIIQDTKLSSIVFLNRTLEEVQHITDSSGEEMYPWGIEDTSIISVA